MRKGRKSPTVFVCYLVCFFQRQKWTKPCISSRWRIQFGFLFPFHVQPINILSFMKTNSSILRDASVHKNCFLLSSQPSFENYSLGCLWRFPGWPKTLERSPAFPCREDYPVIYLLSGWPTKLVQYEKLALKEVILFYFHFKSAAIKMTMLLSSQTDTYKRWKKIHDRNWKSFSLF